MLSVKNLKVSFNIKGKELKAVRGLSFNLEENEILGIVGESGSGKSVSVMSILRLLDKNSSISGSIVLNGIDVLKLKKRELPKYRRENFGFIFQEPSSSFDPIYSIGKCFDETLKTAFPKMSKSERREKAIKTLKEVYIPNPEERLKNFPHQFSGGMLQRIMIALALCTDPKILIADEPTTALDVTIQAQIIKLILEIKKKRKLSVIFISHDIELTTNIADRIIVMYGGLEMESGLAKETIKTPLSPYTNELLKAIPKKNSHYTKSKLHTIEGEIIDPIKPPKGCPFNPRCKYSMPECSFEVPKIKKGEHNYRCILKNGVLS